MSARRELAVAQLSAAPPAEGWYSAQHLAGLPGMPGDVTAVLRRAKKNLWAARNKLRGKGLEYPLSALPHETQEVLIARLIQRPALGLQAPAVPATSDEQDPGTDTLTDQQREIGAARASIVAEVKRIGAVVGMNRAIGQVIALAAAGTLPASLQQLVPVANARRGSARSLSRRTLYRWLGGAARGAGLAPKAPGLDYRLPEDVAAVLALHRQPNKPPLLWCAKEVARTRGRDEHLALYHRAARYKGKLPRSVFHVGRHTGAALAALRPFRRREFLSLAPNDVWVGDGHAAKLSVAHPITGSRFAPEVTLIMDVATRCVMGWSVALSENCLAVADALRHAVATNGEPLLYYSDGGGGQTNKMLDAPITGTLGALGIHHEVGRPGNPQARGVIERAWQTILIPLARRFPTFRGQGADRETLRKVTIDVDRALRAAKRAERGERAEHGAVTALPARLPGWQQFIDALDAEIALYNATHRHRSLPKLDGRRHATPAEYRAARLVETGVEIRRPAGAELAALFMPAIVRRAKRGEVRLFNGIYFHRDLMLVADEDVQVCYDIHDASRVWVKRITGELIAEAVLDGNRDGYMPKPLIERLRGQRAQRRMGRLQGQVAEVQAELRGNVLPAAPALEPLEIPPQPEAEGVALPGAHARRPMFDSDAEKYRWLLDRAAEVNTEDERWLGWYRATSEWTDLFGDGAGEVAAR